MYDLTYTLSQIFNLLMNNFTKCIDILINYCFNHFMCIYVLNYYFSIDVEYLSAS